MIHRLQIMKALKRIQQNSLIRQLVIWAANYPDPLGSSGAHFLTVIVLHHFMA
jgi:hypothetical protein